MKKIAYSLVIALLMGFSVNTFAQNSTAFLNTKTAKKVVDDKTAIVTFQVNNVSDEQTKQKFQDSFKTFQGVTEVSGTLGTGNMATYTMKMMKAGTTNNLKTMFTTAGITTVNIDGNSMPVAEMANYMKAEKAKKN